jgi:Aspartyl protease
MKTIVRGAAAVLALVMAGGSFASEISGVQTVALDQPQVSARFFTSAGDPLTLTGSFGFPTTDITAYLDTGASGVVISTSTATDPFTGTGLVPLSGATFSDFAIGGPTMFAVSEPLNMDVGSSSIFVGPAYNQQFGPIRVQIGPIDVPVDPLLEQFGINGGIDVVGMPTMQDKTVVMDPKPLDGFKAVTSFTDLLDLLFAGDLDTMHTFLYDRDPKPPFNPGTADSDPGVPPTNRSVALSFASFDRFTQVDPSNAEGPTLSSNPFIGPNPLDPAGDTTPGVTLKLGDKQATGSFLLDTGAAASVISTEMARQLGLEYGTGADANNLVFSDGTLVPDQYHITLGGLGGSAPAAGFFLDSLLVRTMQGDPSNDDDPAHLRYLGAPVLVADITLADPMLDPLDPDKFFTLDGLFAMNMLVASVPFSDSCTTLDCLIGLFASLNPSPYDWVVFDNWLDDSGKRTGELALNVRGLSAPDASVPEPASLPLVLTGLLFAVWRSRRLGRGCWKG